MILPTLFLLLVLLNILAWNQAAGMTVLRPYVRKLSGLPGFLRTIFLGMRVLRPAITETPAHHHLPFTEHTFASADGLRLHAWHIPAPDAPAAAGGTLILTFNWFGGSKCALLPHLHEFHKSGYAVFATDLRGHGGSGGHETTLGWREGRDVLAALAYARRTFRPERILLHGVSLGAVSILRAFHLCDLNAGYPQAGRVCAIVLEAAFDRLRNTVRHRVATFGIPEWLPFADLILFWGGVRQQFPAFAHNPAAYARSVDVPALIVHGGADPYIRPEEARRIAAAVPENRATFVVIPGQPHGTALFEHPEAWRQSVLPFLQKQCCR